MNIKDTRKKACPNPQCQKYHKAKFSSDDDYCNKCGTKLIYVCASRNCFSEIEDIGPKHKYCSECQTNRDNRKQAIKDNAKKGAAAVGAGAVAAANILGHVIAKNDNVQKGVDKIADGVIKKVGNKIIK